MKERLFIWISLLIGKFTFIIHEFPAIVVALLHALWAFGFAIFIILLGGLVLLLAYPFYRKGTK